MDPKLFNENAPGRLVKISNDCGHDWAFVPDPLPPELGLNGIGKAHEEAALALGELKGFGRDIARADLFVRPFIRREARLGSIIEVTVVDIRDLYVYETGQLRFPAVGDEQEAALREVLNYVKAIEFAVEQDELPLSLRLIRKLHEILTYQVRGGEAEPGGIPAPSGRDTRRNVKRSRVYGPARKRIKWMSRPARGVFTRGR
jgi:Fic family protein